jgi:hypothetical protein
MKGCSLLLLMMFSISSFSQINWTDGDLKWTDFSGPIPSSSKFDALTHSSISLDFEGQNISLNFTIKSQFTPSKSWKRAGVDTYILKHEQGHFDITEYHARLLRKNLKSYKYKSFASISIDIQRMFDEASDAANEMQVRYDEETNHSINRKKQSKWNKKIKNLLSKTSGYKKQRFKVSIAYVTS